jgi:hypothetical protein
MILTYPLLCNANVRSSEDYSSCIVSGKKINEILWDGEEF